MAQKRTGMFYFLLLSILIGCASSQPLVLGQLVIQESCKLTGRVGDTIVVDWVYSTCMEYSSFQTIEKDS